MINLRRGRQRTREDIAVTRALDRGLVVLEVVSDAVELPLAEIARRAGYSASTVFRLLETLRQRGYVVQVEETALYRIGVKALEVGSAFMRGTRLDVAALTVMRQLADDLGQTVSIGVRDGADLIYLEQIESLNRLRINMGTGSRLPLHATAAGKVLLAHLWEDQLEAVLGPQPYRRLTPMTITRRDILLQQLGDIRRQGFAIDDQECEAELKCYAAPVHDRSGAVVAGLSVSGLAGRLRAADDQRIVDCLKRAALDITVRLGGTASAHASHAPRIADDVFLDG